MSKLLVILKGDIKSLGKRGDVIEVKEGYANNLLFPKDLAEIYNSSSAKKLEKEKKDKSIKDSKIVEEAQLLKDKIEGKLVEIKVKVGKDNKIFGSVSHKDISDAIFKQIGIKVDKKKILSKDIKNISENSVKIKFHSKVQATFIVKVSSI